MASGMWQVFAKVTAFSAIMATTAPGMLQVFVLFFFTIIFIEVLQISNGKQEGFG